MNYKDQAADKLREEAKHDETLQLLVATTAMTPDEKMAMLICYLLDMKAIHRGTTARMAEFVRKHESA